ncbi:anti-sigma factor [Botrimarina hoheduenensis]|uniref:Anti-sigma K factor RskA C-terminal domain-containing protein n=1 Tax=Botrimarina hoheduenensis TaxID=2528000 RepID=A0A5C5W7W8_9BACT|nr:anti-sigma factor [Botrimarina hoheduenensis]TWT46674.1 hypothetical protein Pla111_17750 [Botrimarina hoheduenensis]
MTMPSEPTPDLPRPTDLSRPPLTGDRAARLEELLCDRAVFGLDAADEAELALLMGDALDTATGAELVAAAVAVGLTPSVADPPASLRQQLRSDAADFNFVQAAEQARSLPAPTPAQSGLADRASLAALPSAARHRRLRDLTWAFAAAASLIVGFWLGGGYKRPDTLSAPLAQAPARQMEALRAIPDSRTIAWKPTEDPALIGPRDAAEGFDRTQFNWGEVVWSDAEQRGFMVFNGLMPNDPEVQQYQLWVFDAERSADHPVDGGVFDIPGNPGESVQHVVVPIRVKLSVSRATLFAVTVEKPGGVVVSDRSRLPLLAQL